MQSMTGFGRGSVRFGAGSVVVELRTVNHRFLEVRGRNQREMLSVEALIEKRIRERLARGFCTTSVSFEGSGGARSGLDLDALRDHLDALAQAATASGLTVAELAPILAHAPDLFPPPGAVDPEGFERAVGEACDLALDHLLQMRRTEGAAMSREIAERVVQARAHVDALAGHAASFTAQAHERLRSRVLSLLGGQAVSAELGRRLEAEVAMLADRADINEELSRLCSHLEQLDGLLAAQDGPVGRKLEFLLQEMSRESNTIGAKSQDAAISRLVVALKSEIEKIRECVQNVE